VRPGCCSSRRASSSEGDRRNAPAGAARPPSGGHDSPWRRSAAEGVGPGATDRERSIGTSPVSSPSPIPKCSRALANALFARVAGFFIFLLAFGLRREHAALWWYGLALGASGIGALIGLTLVPRLRQRLSEQQLLLGAIWLVSLAALIAAAWHTLLAQVFLALIIGISGALGQPSFDALTQRYVAPAAQGRAFARLPRANSWSGWWGR